MTSRLSLFSLAIVFIILVATTTTSAQIANPGFETNLNGWTVATGTTAGVCTMPFDLFPSQGTGYLVLDGAGSDTAVAGHGPHPAGGGAGSVAQVFQDFTRPTGTNFTLTVDWEFIQFESVGAMVFNDFFSIDLIDVTSGALVANVVFLDSGNLAGTPAYTNVPGSTFGDVTYVSSEPTGFAGGSIHAPSGYKRAWVNLSTITSPGQQLRLAFSVGNGGDNTNPSIAFVDNVLIAVGQPNDANASLRVLGRPHVDGVATTPDTGNDLRSETPFELCAPEGQSVALRASSDNDGVGWGLFVGTPLRLGQVFAGFGVSNLDQSQPIQKIFDGINPTTISDILLGTISGNVNFYEGQIPVGSPPGELAFQGAMVDPTNSPFFLTLTAATFVRTGCEPEFFIGTGDVLNSGGGLLGDEDAGEVPFATFCGGNGLPFFGQNYSSVFVNTNGHVTFTAADPATSNGSLTDMFTGPPRIAPLWADFEPDNNTFIEFSETAEVLVVSWDNLPAFGGLVGGNRFSIVFDCSGTFTIYYGSHTGVFAPTVGISPGNLAAPATIFNDNVSDGAFSEGSFGTIPAGCVFSEIFDFHPELGVFTDPLDVMTLGVPGPSRITFVPLASGGYDFFTGTR